MGRSQERIRFLSKEVEMHQKNQKKNDGNYGSEDNQCPSARNLGFLSQSIKKLTEFIREKNENDH